MLQLSKVSGLNALISADGMISLHSSYMCNYVRKVADNLSEII